MKKLILASASPRRRELLAQLRLQFDILVSDKEEHYTSTIPSEIVMELSLQKAENVAKTHNLTDCTIIGADTIVVSDGKILGKPKDEADAFSMLSSLQGHSHSVYTGVTILSIDKDGSTAKTCHAEETKVYVIPMSDDEIHAYIATKEPLDKAGGYGIQGRFADFIEKIDGDYYNVVGLPVCYVYRELKKL